LTLNSWEIYPNPITKAWLSARKRAACDTPEESSRKRRPPRRRRGRNVKRHTTSERPRVRIIPPLQSHTHAHTQTYIYMHSRISHAASIRRLASSLHHRSARSRSRPATTLGCTLTFPHSAVLDARRRRSRCVAPREPRSAHSLARSTPRTRRPRPRPRRRGRFRSPCCAIAAPHHPRHSRRLRRRRHRRRR